jgi:protein tyrosine phosphatase
MPDFWQMVFEQGTEVIVMLCQLDEGGQVGCFDELFASLSLPNDCRKIIGIGRRVGTIQ